MYTCSHLAVSERLRSYIHSKFDNLEAKLIWVLQNELLFRSGAAVASLPGASPAKLGLDRTCLGHRTECSFEQTIDGTRIDEVSIYVTDLRFRGLAALVQLLAIALVAPSFWVWWRLPREVSFSPFEVAKAFDAPL